MDIALDALRERLRRWLLIIGVGEVLFGCVVGLIPPTAVLWFRGIVNAHIELTANGVLMIAIGLLARGLGLGSAALWIWFVSLLIGTSANGAAGLVGAFIGQSSRLMPTLNQSFPAPAGSDNPVVTSLLMVSNATTVLGLGLSLVGLLRGGFPGRRMP